MTTQRDWTPEECAEHRRVLEEALVGFKYDRAAATRKQRKLNRIKTAQRVEKLRDQADRLEAQIGTVTRKEQRDYMIEELRALIGIRSADDLAKTFGYDRQVLARQLWRWGEPDLARHFEVPRGQR